LGGFCNFFDKNSAFAILVSVWRKTPETLAAQRFPDLCQIFGRPFIEKKCLPASKKIRQTLAPQGFAVVDKGRTHDLKRVLL